MILFDRVYTSRAQTLALIALVLMFGASFFTTVIDYSDGFYRWHIDKVIHAIAAGALATVFFPYVARPWIAVLGAAFVGALFEVAEAQFTPMAGYGGFAAYVIDTALDIVVDVAGAVTAAKLFFKQFHAG